VVAAARKTFTPATFVDYPVPTIIEASAPTPIQGEEPIPHAASQTLSSGPWRRSIFELVKEEARNGDVAPAFLLALVHEESRFNPHAVSYAGAIGLGQLMPDTAGDRGVRDPFDPVQNLRGTIAHLKYLAGRINATPEPLVGGATGSAMLLASYRSGLGNVRSRGISPNDWKYISRVEMHWRMYQKILHDALIKEDPIGTALILKIP
jgi:soluble lytic murein transglycosylase-like protein